MIAMNASVVEAGCGWRGSWAADAAMPRTQRRRRRAMREDCTAAALQHGAETFSSAAARHRHRALGRGGAMCGGGGCRAMPPIVGFCPRCAPSCPAVQMRAGGRDHSEVARAATMYAPDLCQSTRASSDVSDLRRSLTDKAIVCQFEGHSPNGRKVHRYTMVAL